MGKIKLWFPNGAIWAVFILLLTSCNESNSVIKTPSSSAAKITTHSMPSDKGGAAPINELIGGLEKHLHNNPEDIDGWLLLAKSHHYLGNQSEAEYAMNEAVARGYIGQKVAATNQPSLPPNHPLVGFNNDRNRVIDSLASMIKAEKRTANQTNLSITP